MGMLGFYLQDVMIYRGVENTVDNIEFMVTQLARAGDLTISCYCPESQLGGINACINQGPVIIFERTIERGYVWTQPEILHPLIQGPTQIPRDLNFFQIFVSV